MSKWYPVNQPIRDFIATLKVGMVIEVAEEDGLKQYLIGNMPPDTSTCCGCYDRRYDTEIVTRYRMINWEKP